MLNIRTPNIEKYKCEILGLRQIADNRIPNLISSKFVALKL